MNQKEYRRKWSWSIWQNYPGNCLEGQRKIGEDHQGPSEDSKWLCPKYN